MHTRTRSPLVYNLKCYQPYLKLTISNNDRISRGLILTAQCNNLAKSLIFL
jgi:hypothetical protein